MTRLARLSRSVEGRVVIVTGAASGMGRSTAPLFTDEGAVVAVTNVNEAGAGIVTREIIDAGYRAKGWTLDVADKDDIDRVVAQVAREFGRPDILVNDAGFSAGAPIDSEAFKWPAPREVVKGLRWSGPFRGKSGMPRRRHTPGRDHRQSCVRSRSG